MGINDGDGSHVLMFRFSQEKAFKEKFNWAYV